MGGARRLTEAELLALFVLLGLLVDAVWAAIPGLGLGPALCLAALITLLAREREGAPAPAVRPGRPAGKFGAEAAAVTAFAALPAAAYLAATWGPERLFSGDNGFLLAQHMEAARFWLPKLPGLAALAAALWWSGRRGWLYFAATAAFVVLWRWGWTQQVPEGFARYPAGGLFLALPAQAAMRALGCDDPVNAVRLGTLLAIPCWLLLLRPLVLGRWPDARVLPACALLFWQKNAVYLYSSPYLEPWAAALLLLAGEAALEWEGLAAAYSALVVGLAAVVKEQAVLALPFFPLTAAPWRLPARERGRWLLVTLVSGVPFACYFLFRMVRRVWRAARLGDAADIFAPFRLHRYASHLVFSVGRPGAVALALGLAAALWLASRKDAKRFKRLLLLGAALSQPLFFSIDDMSLPWAGYARFHLISWALVGALLVDLPRRRALQLAAALALLNGAALAPFFSLALTKPAPYRSFSLWADDPAYYDIATLVKRADEAGALEGVTSLTLLDVTPGDYSSDAWMRAYPRLARRFRLGLVRQPIQYTWPPCECREPATAYLAPFLPDVGQRRADEIKPALAARAKCESELRRACARVIEDRFDGELLGLLGVGPRR